MTKLRKGISRREVKHASEASNIEFLNLRIQSGGNDDFEKRQIADGELAHHPRGLGQFLNVEFQPDDRDKTGDKGSKLKVTIGAEVVKELFKLFRFSPSRQWTRQHIKFVI